MVKMGLDASELTTVNQIKGIVTMVRANLDNPELVKMRAEGRNRLGFENIDPNAFFDEIIPMGIPKVDEKGYIHVKKPGELVEGEDEYITLGQYAAELMAKDVLSEKTVVRRIDFDISFMCDNGSTEDLSTGLVLVSGGTAEGRKIAEDIIKGASLLTSYTSRGYTWEMMEKGVYNLKMIPYGIKANESAMRDGFMRLTDLQAPLVKFVDAEIRPNMPVREIIARGEKKGRVLSALNILSPVKNGVPADSREHGVLNNLLQNAIARMTRRYVNDGESQKTSSFNQQRVADLINDQFAVWMLGKLQPRKRSK